MNHILIIEDNEDLLHLMEEVLTNEGYQVTALVYCDDIIETVMDCQPDLVLLDFMLHGINGGELCHQIKTNPVTQALPVIIISGYPRVLESLGDYGSNNFMAKPFSMPQLIRTIDANLPYHFSVAAFQ